MIAKRILLTLIIAATVVSQATVAGAQSEQGSRRAKGGWSAIAKGGSAEMRLQRRDSAHNETMETQAFEPRADVEKLRLVGTWVMLVPDSPGAPGFSALQTYNADGTMTETSSLLALLAEGPAHGVWSGKKSDYQVTFELFAFDETGQSVGRIRVRVSIHLVDEDNLTADAAVDFIEPDGNVIPDIGSTPFTGTRVKLVPR